MSDNEPMDMLREAATSRTLVRIECSIDFMQWMSENTREKEESGFFATAPHGIPVIAQPDITGWEARLIGPDGEFRRLIRHGDQVYSIDPSVFELAKRPVRIPLSAVWSDDDPA